MSTRISSAIVICLATAACGSDEGAATPDAGQGEEIGRIACAVPDSDRLTRSCTLDRAETDRGVVLTVHQPDGGFHRLRITRDGRGVVAADGAEPARVSVVGNSEIEVAIGGARYRLPATIGPVGAE